MGGAAQRPAAKGGEQLAKGGLLDAELSRKSSTVNFRDAPSVLEQDKRSEGHDVATGKVKPTNASHWNAIRSLHNKMVIQERSKFSGAGESPKISFCLEARHLIALLEVMRSLNLSEAKCLRPECRLAAQGKLCQQETMPTVHSLQTTATYPPCALDQWLTAAMSVSLIA